MARDAANPIWDEIQQEISEHCAKERRAYIDKAWAIEKRAKVAGKDPNLALNKAFESGELVPPWKHIVN